MITRLSHVTIWVEDHEEALAFYVGKLGFEKRTDATLEGFRWLTVAPKGQLDLEIVLMKLVPGPMMDSATLEELRALTRKGALGGGVFAVDDCPAIYEDLKAKGVEFMSAPREQPYGIEATLKDPFGNWFSMTQHRG